MYDIWKSTLLPGMATSMHCHPRKDTALLCLSGTGRLSLVQASHLLATGDVAYLPKGVFHATENVGQTPLELVEVETPRNKLDLVRLTDRYGRAGASYEQESQQYQVVNLVALDTPGDAKLRPTC